MKLATGTYLVGRSDGGVDPFFVVIHPDDVYLTGAACLGLLSDSLVDLANESKLWWWRRCSVPSFAPTDEFLYSLPAYPLRRGGL